MFPKRYLSAVLAGAAFASCAHEGAYLPERTTSHDLENRAPLVLLDDRVQRSVTSSGIETGETADGRLEVAAHLRNREARRIEVDVGCVFKDEAGFAIDETPFVRLHLAPNAQETVRFAALSDKARRFTIRVRQAQ